MRVLRIPFATRRRSLVVLAAFLAISASTWFLFGRSDADDTGTTTTTAEVTSSTVQDTVTGSGTLAAAQSEDLSFSSSGRVTHVYVEAGDTVKKGAKLAAIDTATLEASLASAEAQLDAAQTTAADDSGEAAAQRAAHDAAVASAAAQVAEAEDALDAATLTAPFAGQVATVSVEVGDQVGSASPTDATGGSSAVTVISPTMFTVTANVTADDVAKVAKKMQAQVTPAGTTEPVFGTVSAVSKVAEVSDDGTATFPVTVALTGEQKGLYAGTSADVSIIVESRDDVLSVPTAAVTTTDGTTYVQKLVDGAATKTKVEIGQTFGPTTEILSGLKEGDTVQYEQTTRRVGGSGGQGGFELPEGFTPPEGGQFPGGAVVEFQGAPR